MSDRLPWFRCVPSALLGAMAGLQPDEILIYLTVLLRIYETGGPIPDSARTLARRTGITVRRAAIAIEGLSMARKITILSDDRIDSASTHAELDWQRESRGDKSHAGRESAKARQRRARIDRIAEGDKRVVRFPDQKTLKKQRSDATPVEQVFNDRDEEEEQEPLSRSPERPISPAWLPDEEDVASAIAIGVPADEIGNQAAIFRDRMLERKQTSGDWRASWRNWARRYRPDMAMNARAVAVAGRGGRRELPTSADTANLLRLAEKFRTEQSPGDAFHAAGSGSDDDLIIVEVDDEDGGDEPGGGRGEDRDVPWQAGNASRPSDALLRAAGQGGVDHRAAAALRRQRTPRA